MSLVQNRNINDLRSTFRERFMLAMEEYNERFEPKIFLVEGLRSKELQAKYLREKKTKIMNSNHLTGNAADIAFRISRSQIYPDTETPRLNVCRIMRKYGIVNAYYDLKRGFDKPHFQPVEIQTPSKISPSYVVAKKWLQKIKSQMRARSVAWHKTASKKFRDQLHERNNRIRILFDSIGIQY